MTSHRADLQLFLNISVFFVPIACSSHKNDLQQFVRFVFLKSHSGWPKPPDLKFENEAQLGHISSSELLLFGPP